MSDPLVLRVIAQSWRCWRPQLFLFQILSGPLEFFWQSGFAAPPLCSPSSLSTACLFSAMCVPQPQLSTFYFPILGLSPVSGSHSLRSYPLSDTVRYVWSFRPRGLCLLLAFPAQLALPVIKTTEALWGLRLKCKRKGGLPAFTQSEMTTAHTSSHAWTPSIMSRGGVSAWPDGRLPWRSLDRFRLSIWSSCRLGHATGIWSCHGSSLLSYSEHLEQLQPNQSLPEKSHSWKSDHDGGCRFHNWEEKSSQEFVAGLKSSSGRLF